LGDADRGLRYHVFITGKLGISGREFLIEDVLLTLIRVRIMGRRVFRVALPIRFDTD
jgi:hypothetical protein